MAAGRLTWIVRPRNSRCCRYAKLRHWTVTHLGIFHTIVVRGDTYAFDPGISRADALAYWLHPASWCYVAEHRGNVRWYLHPKGQPTWPWFACGQRSIMVSPGARGLGVGRGMGEHSLSEARRLGFRAMQFNFVVSTNEPAIRLGKQLGFEIVGTLPGVFRHPEKGLLMRTLCFARSPWPDHAFNRTRRYGASTWRASARRSGYLQR